MTGSIPALAVVPRFDSEDVRLVAYSLAGGHRNRAATNANGIHT
jgi:hypothetical protein